MDLLYDEARALGLNLTAQHRALFQTYYEELIAWNRYTNLTTIIDFRQVQIRHFLDALACLLILKRDNDKKVSQIDCTTLNSRRVIDVGTGAGFPGLVLKIVCPGLQLTLLEATRKKVDFLQAVVRRLELEEVQAVWARAEEAGRDAMYREQYDIAVARAVAGLPVLVEYALPFCRVGGVFIAQKGAHIEEELEQSRYAIQVLGGRLREVQSYELPTLDEPRTLVVIEKVYATPKEYPRRPGVPAKKPLSNVKRQT